MLTSLVMLITKEALQQPTKHLMENKKTSFSLLDTNSEVDKLSATEARLHHIYLLTPRPLQMKLFGISGSRQLTCCIR